MKYIREELENLIYVEKKSYREIGRIYGVSDTYIKKVAQKLGIPLPRRQIFPEGYVPANKGKKKKKFCIECGVEMDFYCKKFCNIKCQKAKQSRECYENFLKNNEEYCRASYSPKLFKKHFLEDQDHKCALCGIKDIWNDKPLMLVLDHIDGDAANNKRENLRLVCSNCDSQLDTYKSKNKNSARKERYKLQRK